jgi:hypothetical protein
VLRELSKGGEVDALALALLWLALVVPVGLSAVLRRRDSIADFERALESLQPGPRADTHVVPTRRTDGTIRQARRRRVVRVLAVLAAATLIVAALSRARLALGAGMLLVDLGIAYAAAVVATDRRHLSL